MKTKSENQYLSFYGHLKVKKRSKQGEKKLKLKNNIPTIYNIKNKVKKL